MSHKVERKKSKHRPLVLVLIATTTIAIQQQGDAHSDPRGDVYPNVHVANGNFVIDFENNDNESDTLKSPVFQMIFAADGSLLAPRHFYGGNRSLSETMGDANKNTIHVGDEILEFTGGRSEQPAYTLTKNGRKELHRLAWPENYECAFEAAAADEKSICVASVTNRMLFLSYFERGRIAVPETVQITKKDEMPFIWDFPVASNLVQIGRRYLVAWPRFNTKSEKFECVISTWKPGEKNAKEIVLDKPADWNSHLSMANIGNRLCLAYHCLGGDDYVDRSRIITIFQTINGD